MINDDIGILKYISPEPNTDMKLTIAKKNTLSIAVD